MRKRKLLSGDLTKIARLILPWSIFLAFLLWGWRVRDIFNNVPAYGDVLEVLWGTLWYRDSLTHNMSPFFTSLVFHPYGWHTTTLAHTPVFFLIALLLFEMGGVAFAYNVLAILSLCVAFAGSFRFIRLFASHFAAVVAALVFTFIGMRWFRVGGGHQHILWASSLLPWLAWLLEKIRRTGHGRATGWLVLAAGLIWGIIINFSLYGIFLGGLVFTLWGRELIRPQRIGQAIVAAGVALLAGAPATLLYMVGSQQDQVKLFGITHNLYWGASLNSLIVPSVFHPLDIIRHVARSLYTGPYDESGVANLGLLTFLLGAIGLIYMPRCRHRRWGLVWLTGTGLILALGILLRWNGEIVRSPLLISLNQAIWSVGHWAKPALFVSARAEPLFRKGIPLPGLVLTALVPFWESARTLSRYALVGGMGLIALAACGLQRCPRSVRYLMAALWLIETLPAPTGNLPVPLRPHPAYEWLAQQEMNRHEGIVDIQYPSLMMGGETLFATWLHQKPTASGVGSFWPEHTISLLEMFAYDPQALASPDTALTLRQYNIRYIVLHVKGDKEREMWSLVSQNSALQPLRCFEPRQDTMAWPYPICVAQVLAPSLPIGIIRQGGWSDLEEWGVWAEGQESQAAWVVMSSQDSRLRIEAFPYCLPDRRQSVSVIVNEHPLMTYHWTECETWQAEVTIPAAFIHVGRNSLIIKYDYAVRPVDVTHGENGDVRELSVGFTRLEIGNR